MLRPAMSSSSAIPSGGIRRIESHDLKGKTLVPFATSGGSGISGSVKALRETYPDLKWQEGKLLNGVNRNAIQNWVRDVMKKQ